jgi:hypothetical protein
LSIDTYAALKTAIANRLRRADTGAYVDDWISLAESDIYRRLRTRDMETAFSGTISSGAVALPTGYVDLKFSYINRTPVQWLERKAPRWIYEKYPTRAADSVPKYISREGSNFIFGPYPDSEYSVAGVYYKNLGAVSATAHALFTSNPDVYVYGGLLTAVRELKDDRGIARWEPMYERAILAAQKSSDMEEYSGGPLAVTTS